MKRKKLMLDKRIRCRIFIALCFFASLFSISSSAFIWDEDSPFPWDDISRETIYFRGDCGDYYGYRDTLQYCAFSDDDFCWLTDITYDILERDALEHPDSYCGLENFMANTYYRGPFGSFDVKETATFEGKEYRLIGVKCAFSSVEGLLDQYPVFNVTLPDNIKYFFTVFHHVEYIENIKLPRDLEVMVNCVNACENVKELKLPSSLRILEKSVKCLDIEELTLPPNLKKVGIFSFDDLPKLKSIDFGDSLEEIEDRCFNYLPLIEHISLPASIHKIGSSCFDKCETLKTVEFNSLQPIEMGENFNICPAIQKIVLKCPEAYDISDNCFKDVDFNKCILVVPNGSKNAYQQANGWCRFKNIMEDQSGVDRIISNNTKSVEFFNNHLVNSTSSTVIIYTGDGKILKTVTAGADFVFNGSGVYYYTCGSAAGKIIIK